MIADMLQGQRAELTRVSWGFCSADWRAFVANVAAFGVQTMTDAGQKANAKTLSGLRTKVLALADDTQRAEVDKVMNDVLAVYEEALAAVSALDAKRAAARAQ